MLRRSLAIASILLFTACSSTGSRAGGDASSDGRMRVTLRNYDAEQLFELVSESHTNRVEYYSQERADAARKIQSDEVMGALVDELDSQGFEDFAQPGRAPTRKNEVVSQSLEIERGDETEHWVVGKGSAASERLRFRDCMLAFVELYNLTASYQVIENPEGSQIFPRNRGGGP